MPEFLGARLVHKGMEHHLSSPMKLGKYSLLVQGRASPKRMRNMISSFLETTGPLFMIQMEVLLIRKHNLHLIGEIFKTFCATRVCNFSIFLTKSMYQKHRLGTLGIEWRPPSVNFAVGPTYHATTGEYQIISVIDPDRWEPLPEITDFIELEPENEAISDDTDSEYNGMDDYSSEGEQDIWGGHASGASYSKIGRAHV